MSELIEVELEIESELKDRAEKVFAEGGLTLEEATLMFFEESVRLGRFPFDVVEEQNNENDSANS